MLALPGTNSWGFQYVNQDAGSVQPGTSVTPGASDAEGTATAIATGSNISQDVYLCRLIITNAGSTGVSKPQLLDFGWDTAGGTSYTWFFQNLVMGGSFAAIGPVGREYVFPCYIPSGSQVAVRCQGTNATAGTIRVYAEFWGKPRCPELVKAAFYTETLGTITGSNGTSFTPGNASWGSWASLGTTTKRHFWVQIGLQIDNANTSAHATHCQVGIGDGTSFHIIGNCWMYTNTSESIFSTLMTDGGWQIPAGATLYVRGNNSAAPVSGYNATAVCFGG